jgi:DNA-binding NarL/FixJ family response regulator
VLIVDEDVAGAISIALSIDYGGGSLRVAAIAATADEALAHVAGADTAVVCCERSAEDAVALAHALRDAAPHIAVVLTSEQPLPPSVTAGVRFVLRSATHELLGALSAGETQIAAPAASSAAPAAPAAWRDRRRLVPALAPA